MVQIRGFLRRKLQEAMERRREKKMRRIKTRGFFRRKLQEAMERRREKKMRRMEFEQEKMAALAEERKKAFREAARNAARMQAWEEARRFSGSTVSRLQKVADIIGGPPSGTRSKQRGFMGSFNDNLNSVLLGPNISSSGPRIRSRRRSRRRRSGSRRTSSSFRGMGLELRV